MNIGINMTNLYPGKIGGAEQYVRNVIRKLAVLGQDKLFLFLNSIAVPTFEESESVKICHVEESEDRDIQLNFYIDYYNIEIIFAPLFFIAPNPCPVPAVASILDVQHEFFPQYFDAKVLKDIRRSTKTTLDQADGIITISSYSKATITEKYQIAADKILVTHLNSDGCFDKPLDPVRINELKKEIGCDYIFYPANTWPHKNHMNLLKAYKILKEEHHTDLKLVFTGDSKQQKKDIEGYIKDNGLEGDIKYLGYLPQEDMPYIFANARMLAFPSIFEGFGIPLVEAMKAGVAIACSECGSIPEVAGDAALYFNAYDPHDIAEKLYQLSRDTGLRKELIARGKRMAEKYSWEKCAKDTREYLQKIISATDKTRKEKVIYTERFPLVSIITPSYNQGKFIRDTIESVLSQDYPNIEYIVMDGGSTDETVEILKEYGDRIIWKSEKDKGQADAVNKGIELAKGQIIGWLNSDDTYLEGAVGKAVSYLITHPDTDMVYGEGYYTDITGKITERYLTERYDYRRLAQQCIICQPTAFFTKDIVQKAGMLEEQHQLSMDYELWMRIAGNGKIAYLPEYLATSRMYEDNKTLSRRKEVFEETCNAVKKHYGYVPISWIDGYTDYLCKGTRGLSYCIRNITLFLKYNWSNPQYCKREIPVILKSRLFIVKRLLLPRIKRGGFSERYADNWISALYRERIRNLNEYDKAVIKVNNQWPLKKPLKLTFSVNGKVLKKITLMENGIEEIEVKLNQFHTDTGEITIRPNRTFCPAALNGSADTRVLSCQIESIKYVKKEKK